MALTDRSEIKDILARHNFYFSKAMGQNFLVNPSVCPRMAEACGASEEIGVLEIGPGIGVLTEQLAMRAKKVVCIELDKRLPDILAETLKDFDNVTIIQGDVMKVDLHKIIEEHFSGMKVAVCANLPYYITTPIIMKILEENLPIESITVMVQKEAAQRLCSPPGARVCGAISAGIYYYSVAEPLFIVSPGSFFPPPKIDSQVINLEIRKSPPVTPKSVKFMFAVIKSSFLQRRKRAVNSISATIGYSKVLVEETFADLNLNPNARAEELTLQNFADISDCLSTKSR